jgi:hypothetical protein
LTKEIRFDRAKVLDYKEDEYGFLTVDLAITKTGVMPYRRQNGEIQQELKHPDEIFSDKTMESAKGKPITDEHPFVLLNSENYTDYFKGTTHLNVRKDDKFLVVSETVFDDNLIAQILSGKKKEVSIGFEADIVTESGEFEGEKYDAIQKNIVINHVAHTKAGRAGEDVSARIDSIFDGYDIEERNGIAVLAPKDFNQKSKKNDSNNKPQKTNKQNNKQSKRNDNSNKEDENDMEAKVIKIDGEEVEVNVDAAEKVEELQTKLDEAQESVEDLTSERDTLKGKLDAAKDSKKTLEGRVDDLENKLNSDGDVNDKVSELLGLFEEVTGLIGDSVSIDMNPKEMKAEVIKRLDEDFELTEEMSDDYLNARYDGAKATIKNLNSDSLGNNNLRFAKQDSNRNTKLDEKRKTRTNLFNS